MDREDWQATAHVIAKELNMVWQLNNNHIRLSGKESAWQWDTGYIMGLGRSPGGGNDNPLRYSCLESPMDRGTWLATVYKVAKNQRWLKWLNNSKPWDINIG